MDCAEKHCEVWSSKTRPLGLSLDFGDDGKLTAIIVDSICVFSDSLDCHITPSKLECDSDLIARQFHGNTYQLFNQFSERFCRQLLDQPSQKKENTNLKVTWVVATYDKLGLTIRYTIYRRGAPEYQKEFQMTLVQPQMRATSASGARNNSD